MNFFEVILRGGARRSHDLHFDDDQPNAFDSGPSGFFHWIFVDFIFVFERKRLFADHLHSNREFFGDRRRNCWFALVAL